MRVLLLLVLVLFTSGYGGCQPYEPGPLTVNIIWETSTRGIFGRCHYVEVDVVDYTVYDYQNELVYSSGGVTECEDYIDIEAEGGEHTIDIQGYYYDEGELILGWDALCTDLLVDGPDTELYECKVRRVRDGERDQ